MCLKAFEQQTVPDAETLTFLPDLACWPCNESNESGPPKQTNQAKCVLKLK